MVPERLDGKCCFPDQLILCRAAAPTKGADMETGNGSGRPVERYHVLSCCTCSLEALQCNGFLFKAFGRGGQGGMSVSDVMRVEL